MLFENDAQYRDISFGNASALKHFNVFVKRFKLVAFMRKRGALEVTVKIISSSYEETDETIYRTNGNRTSEMSKDGV